MPDSPKRIHLIFKTHLDVGFTDFSRTVLHNYFTSYIPKAIELARTLRESDQPERFVWTTGSYLIYEYLEQAAPAERRRMEAAIIAGDIAWHALPCTLHSESMDADLFRFGLSLSQELDHRFGKHTIAAKMTDVPGHTRAIVTLLAEAGVQFLHIGVNHASTPPDVPPVFRWRDPDGVEIMVMYHKSSYGELMTIPGLADAIAFAHTGDNLGPQGIDELREVYALGRKQFPHTQLIASTLDAFAARLATIRDQLPLISDEIGDTWIHGVGTDPQKMAHFRELLRARQDWIVAGTPAAALKGFHRKLLLVPEHTWGLDLKTHLADWQHYPVSEFQAVRQLPNYQKMEASWQEQRDYLTQAISELPAALQQDAQSRLAAIAPCMPDCDGYAQITDFFQPIEAEHFTLALHPERGYIRSLIQKSNRRQWTADSQPLGSFWYQTFSGEDTERYYAQYVKHKRQNYDWSHPDFAKPGLETSAEASKIFMPTLEWAGQRSDAAADQLLLIYSLPEESYLRYGGMRQVTLQISLERATPTLHFDLQWFQKTANRQPEACWFSFVPRVTMPQHWYMDKLGEWTSPYEVIRDGNRHLHAVGKELKYVDKQGQLSIESLDAPLVAPGEPDFYTFSNRQPNLRKGVHFLLCNNKWGTNFPMWSEGDARFRFILRF